MYPEAQKEDLLPFSGVPDSQSFRFPAFPSFELKRQHAFCADIMNGKASGFHYNETPASGCDDDLRSPAPAGDDEGEAIGCVEH
jgi:hypothetical protein